MIADDSEKLSPLRAHSPAAMPSALRARLLSAMKTASAEAREAADMAELYQPTPLRSNQHQRFLAAMQAVHTHPRLRYRAWWAGSAAAVAAVAVSLVIWWPQPTQVPAMGPKPVAPRVTMTRQVFGADASSHCDTFLMEGEDASRLVIRVSEKQPVLLPDDVI